VSQRPLVVFIHGTWSNLKIWNWMESKLQGQFSNQFGFARVKWSGGNSASARAAGVKNFEKLVSAKPDQPLYIISHSHGANVVLQSADQVRNRVKLLICLNSPILSAKRFRLPVLVSIALWALSLIIGVAAVSWSFNVSGLGDKTALDSGLAAFAGAIALAAILFYVANTRGASILLVVFPFFAVMMAVVAQRYTWLWLIEVYQWMIPHLFFGSMIAFGIFTGGVALLLPALSTYAFWTRWRFTYNLDPSPILRTVHIVSIDDEIFLLLGIALGVQRITQLLLGPIYGSFAKVKLSWFAWLICIPLTTIHIVGQHWHRAAFLYDKLEFLGRYSIIPLSVAALFAALIIYLKILLFGIAYGWDVAGLSVDHAIYVSQGSVANPTEVYTLEPEGASMWVSHVKIHSSPEALKLVVKTLIEALNS
jgi:pimeloyl-ACP methyl ester carboxylesterase